MAAFIVNNNTLKRYKDKPYASKGTAQAAQKRLGLSADEYTVMSTEEWLAADEQVEVKNLMSGKPVMIRRSERGNPALDPSMEGYFTM